jgi:two-component system phosphate regulon sensor histidine kinase PhoR
MDTLKALLRGLPLPVVLIGEDARILGMNRPAEDIFGAEMTGRHYMSAMRQPEIVALVDRVLAGAEAAQARVTLTGPSRDTIYRVLVAPVARTGISLAFEDITDIEQALAIRRDFVANVSHELRTPLTALAGFIETLKGAARDDAAARVRFLDIMEREAARMNRLVGDLLSLSRVEAEERIRPSELVDVVALSRSVMATLRGMAEDAGVRLELDASAGRIDIPADPDQLTQVLHNLLENAIKYGSGGGVARIEVQMLEYSARLRGAAVAIAISDNGDGIDPIHLPRLTERFYRVDNHRSREKGGTGLGLAIVKHILNRHRGQLQIESTPGQGSTFRIMLPASTEPR